MCIDQRLPAAQLPMVTSLLLVKQQRPDTQGTAQVRFHGRLTRQAGKYQNYHGSPAGLVLLLAQQ